MLFLFSIPSYCNPKSLVNQKSIDYTQNLVHFVQILESRIKRFKEKFLYHAWPPFWVNLAKQNILKHKIKYWDSIRIRFQKINFIFHQIRSSLVFRSTVWIEYKFLKTDYNPNIYFGDIIKFRCFMQQQFQNLTTLFDCIKKI